MEATIPLYPLIAIPVAVSVYFFWRRLRQHLAILRLGRPLDRTDRPLERLKGVAVYVIGQRRLLNDLGPGLAHAFVFWGFLILLATSGNYLTNGLVEAILGLPLGGVMWGLVVGLANLFIALIIGALIIRRRAAHDPAVQRGWR